MSKYYRYRDNFEAKTGYPNLRLFDTLQEAYNYLLQDAEGACLFQCDGIEMPEDFMPPPLDHLQKVIEACGVVEVQIGFYDQKGKDIWILEKDGRKEDYMSGVADAFIDALTPFMPAEILPLQRIDVSDDLRQNCYWRNLGIVPLASDEESLKKRFSSAITEFMETHPEAAKTIISNVIYAAKMRLNSAH